MEGYHGRRGVGGLLGRWRRKQRAQEEVVEEPVVAAPVEEEPIADAVVATSVPVSTTAVPDLVPTPVPAVSAPPPPEPTTVPPPTEEEKKPTIASLLDSALAALQTLAPKKDDQK